MGDVAEKSDPVRILHNSECEEWRIEVRSAGNGASQPGHGGLPIDQGNQRLPHTGFSGEP